jgi:hypothetical protein
MMKRPSLPARAVVSVLGAARPARTSARVADIGDDDVALRIERDAVGPSERRALHKDRDLGGSGSSPSCSMIWATSTTKPPACNRSTILSARKCYLCPRNKLSPCGAQTGERAVARVGSHQPSLTARRVATRTTRQSVEAADHAPRWWQIDGCSTGHTHRRS